MRSCRSTAHPVDEVAQRRFRHTYYVARSISSLQQALHFSRSCARASAPPENRASGGNDRATQTTSVVAQHALRPIRTRLTDSTANAEGEIVRASELCLAATEASPGRARARNGIGILPERLGAQARSCRRFDGVTRALRPGSFRATAKRARKSNFA